MSEDSDEDSDDEDGDWVISKLFSEMEITGASPVLCQADDCEGPRRGM